MYQRGNFSQNMNPAQRLDILKKEMEHLAVEKEILQAQTRNLEMEKEVCKLRQGILALQSNTGVSTSEATVSKATTKDEIVVTPRRIVKKSVNKSPIQPAFSPPRFIRRHEEPEEDRSPILTPAARMIQASLDLNLSQSIPLKASSFVERKQVKRRAEESVHQMSTPPLKLNDNSPESSRPAKRQRISNLERFNDDDDDEFDSIDIHAIKHKSLVVQKESSPSKPVKLENKKENVKSEVLTPTARLIKAEMEKKQAEKEAAEKAKQDALKAKKMAKEMKKKTADQDVSFSLQRPQLEEKIDEPTTSSTLVEQSIHKKQTGDEVILTQAAKKVQADLDLKKTVIHRTENIVVTETRKQVVISPKIISDNSSSESESKLTPTARAVKELMESKLQAQKKTSPKPASRTITKPASPVSPTVSKPMTPALPDTPKSRGVHFAKVERVHLNKPYVPEKVMTPEKVKSIIKPPRLTRRPLHPERVQLKPRKSTRGNVCFSQAAVEDAEDSIEEEESESVTNSQTTTGDMSSQSSTSSRPSIKSRGRKRQIETDSSNDDFSEIEESAATPLPTKRRRTYITTPHPVKGRRRSKVAAVAVSDDDENDYADVSDTSDAVSDKPSPKQDTKPVQKRGRRKKAVVEVIEDEVPLEKDNSQDKEEEQLVKEEIPIEKEPVHKKTTKSKTTQLKQTKKGKESSKASESNEESEKNEEIVISTPTKKRRSSLLSRKVAVSETENKSEDVISTPTRKKRLSLPASTKTIRNVSEDNDESEDSTIGTPSKRRRSILQKSSRATSSKMADIPEDKSVPTPAQREIMAKMNAKSTSKGKKKEDSEESSPEKTATAGNSKSTQASKGKKKEDSVDSSTEKTATTVNSKSTQASKGKKREDSVDSSPEKTATTAAGNSKSTQASKGKKKEDSVDSSSEKTATTVNSKSTQASKGKKKEDSEDSSPEKTATTVNTKSAQVSKNKKKEDSEDSSTEKTATTGKKAGGSKGKEEKIEHKPNLTPAARQVLARMQERENSKKTKGTVTSDVNTDSDASDASKKKSKRK